MDVEGGWIWLVPCRGPRAWVHPMDLSDLTEFMQKGVSVLLRSKPVRGPFESATCVVG